MNGQHIVDAINNCWHQRQEDGRRNHLGGSLIGRECERELWYSFRWANIVKHNGRTLRLFARGHREEYRFVNYLEDIGCEVRAFSERLVYHPESDDYILLDWEQEFAGLDDVSNSEEHIAAAQLRGLKLGQFRIKDAEGHFGGSLDGKVRGVPAIEKYGPFDHTTWGLTEFKTHGEKSFAKLTGTRKWDFQKADFKRTGGVPIREAKPEHWHQMQTYMHKAGLPFAVYMAVNKDTDELYVEIVLYDAFAGSANIAKARDIIRSPKAPRRINESPSFFKCKFCDFHGQCHKAEPLAVSCRTCQYARPENDGEWYCGMFSETVPNDFTRVGCPKHKPVTD